MTQVIGLLSQKGGPGKSTLARALAVGYARSGWSVKVCDFDTGQATVTSWNRRRLAAGHSPVIAVETFGSVSQALKNADAFDLLIFDGKPNATGTAKDIAEAADLIVIPAKPSVDDLEPAALLADWLVKQGIEAKRIAYALSQFGKNPREAEAAREYFGYTGIAVLPGAIPVSPAFVTAHDLGRSLIEASHKSPREAAGEVVQGVIDLLRKLTK